MSKEYSCFKIRLASSDEIKEWSYGEVKNHETINYRTLKPVEGGLFAEEIFGPVKDYQCACTNKSKKSINYENRKCPICGVEITSAKVRRERMGHVTLEAPVVHNWFLGSNPSKIGRILDIKTSELREVVYYASYIVTEPGSDTDLEFKQILTPAQYDIARAKYHGRFKAQIGAEAIQTLLKKLDLDKEIADLRRELKNSSKQIRENVIKRLSVLTDLKNSGNNPEWMVLDILPVLPPDLRPMVSLDGGRFATTGINDLYRKIINRNNRLRKEKGKITPAMILNNEKRLLQVAVDALFGGSASSSKKTVSEKHPLKSFADQFKGKQGRFRQNLLGKRVDYSGRSVIVIGPNLKMHQCGVPREMALILFKPFIFNELVQSGVATNVQGAKRLYDNRDAKIWGALEKVILEHPVLLNRAPTLHRLGVQAFEPILIEGKAIQLHPLVCTAFNADFDGDQMSIHVPLSEEAQAEARIMMLASNNILNPRSGKPIVTPGQDIVLGNYYLTMEKKGDKGEGRVFKDIDEAEMAYSEHQITLHARIAFKVSSLPFVFPVEHQNDYIITTYGKILFNTILHPQYPYVNEPSDANIKGETPHMYFAKVGTNIKEFINELDASRAQKDSEHRNDDTPYRGDGSVRPFKKGTLQSIIATTFARYKVSETTKMLDRLKDIGYKYCTKSGITVSAFDVNVFADKQKVIENAQTRVDRYKEDWENGTLTDKQRYTLVCNLWAKVKDDMVKSIKIDMEDHHNLNSIYMMYDSGARGDVGTYTQLAGMRGNLANAKSETIEIPVTACLREGLSMREFFISTHGSRKGSTDTALRTADSGYQTRQLVDVSHDVVLREFDCGTDKGLNVTAIIDSEGKEIESLYDRILGRYAYRDNLDPVTGEVVLHKNQYIDEEAVKKVREHNLKEVGVRSVCTCNSKSGVCVKCYGRNLATANVAEVGETVGVIAAQSIGEPGTQLTMRTFHSGGLAGGDITTGLPRVKELFGVHSPKGAALIAAFDGDVKVSGSQITVKGLYDEQTYTVKAGTKILVSTGQHVHAGDALTPGSKNIRDLLRYTNIETVQKYISEEVQKVYTKENVPINDKHLEIIIRQMTRKLVVTLEGDTELIPGQLVTKQRFEEANKKAFDLGLKPAVAVPVVQGIIDAALTCESFLSAASFQHTTKVLTDAALAGKVDYLTGLKENVIIGGIIPAGTGILTDKSFDYEKPIVPEKESFNNYDF